MKIIDGFVLKAIAGTYMVVPLGSQVAEFGSIIKLSETGAFLWEQLSEDKDKSELVCALINEFDVDEATASSDIDKFVEKLRAADLLN